ncbi:hypothetical protein [Bradyrhizobium cytisi]|uniref:SIR2-like domain-containing protein n=1 Tax=Bradyrhizobium cytisi TaxID=515489 RepID=A0A5S4WGZ0_9BRAD|nr:hypothetical protein [Bradyrhizobium cytisi]TYL80823.1 hypothetical protein FXB38_24275 [Bradyrhizobium cytisi]
MRNVNLSFLGGTVITTPTVFLLGAGASYPYGLPLGSELKSQILDRYANDTGGHTVHLTNTTSFGRTDIDRFIGALRYSGLLSVDAFLERRPEFMEIGKAMMGIELLHAEVHERLWQEKENWLTYLYSQMIGNTLEEFADNKVAFVTFNYDRCVEHFFFTSLKNSFGRSDDETAAIAKKISVVHLHGKLGHLPWEGTKSPIDFGDNQIDVRKMKILINEIKVVHEDHTLDGRDIEFAMAQVMLTQARRVYLLGFGFGARNVQRIKLDALTPHAFCGTAYGLTDKEISDCKSLAGGRVLLLREPCLAFMRQYVDFN